MQHVFYSDGNARKISWIIKTNESTVKQNRTHADVYYDKVTALQSKYIALHVGLFWGIGTFIIKNEDQITVKTDNQIMYEHLKSNKKINDEFIEKRTHFINQLILQRKLKINFELIQDKENIATKII